MIVWSRPITATWPTWCAVLSTEHGSIRTYCSGRFAVSDPHESTECPVIGDCCKACVELVAADSDAQPIDTRLRDALTGGR